MNQSIEDNSHDENTAKDRKKIDIISDNPIVVITAPHSLCDPDVKLRSCDESSEYAAVSLYDAINIPTVLLLSDQIRSKIDLSLENSRDTSYRKSLTKILNKIQEVKAIGFLIDIHSFSEDRDEDVIIVNNSLKREYLQTLIYMLNLANIKQSLIKSVDINDITDEALSKGLSTISIEFNEKLEFDKIDEINKVINTWIKVEIDVFHRKSNKKETKFVPTVGSRGRDSSLTSKIISHNKQDEIKITKIKPPSKSRESLVVDATSI